MKMEIFLTAAGIRAGSLLFACQTLLLHHWTEKDISISLLVHNLFRRNSFNNYMTYASKETKSAVKLHPKCNVMLIV